ncbi:HAD-IIIC family phosphatase [Aquincola sp. S2]|uniref:HAD-IIIC family phosphatase n=1 Tax=Pseudaquabacterium terrae TaxID=2732868 RepID=A0ABX2ED79_9BURK|nr:HAD-IIIC family phosphatase [Aquabacterium terrae]NRF66507.1 HAD-IIIC family phosphatase [Aquabacterium terrae]
MADIDRLLTLESRAAVRTQLASLRAPLTLPQAQNLRERIVALEPAPKQLRLAIVHTYTSDLLQPWLDLNAAMAGFTPETYHAPYGLALQEASPGSALVAHRPDLTLLMLRREDLHPDLARPIVGLSPERRDALRAACLAQVREWLSAFRAQPVGQLLLTLLPPVAPPSLGLYDTLAESSEAAWWSTLKVEIAAWMRAECPASLLLDLDETMLQVGRANFFDRRYWYSSRYPFTAAAAMEFTQRVIAVGELKAARQAKVLVLDADNTLWGGIVGEDGFDGIALGPDYPGNAYVEFQRRILDFQQRGFILAMCSKNNPADVEQVLRDHPHQLLRAEHFAARRVNWEPKADNLVSLAKELNLGLESFIFVDDSDHECAAVRHRLPEVEVVQVPARAVDVPGCLDRIARLEVLSLTAEDQAKTQMYAQEQRRRELAEELGAGGGGDYLARLQMKMQVGLDERGHLVRLAQLTRKTNQFNLTTRRYDDEQMRAALESDQWLVFHFSLADVFGDSGIVGLAMWRMAEAGAAELDTFLMSCRVIGRQAEAAFLHAQMRLLAERGVQQLVADYLPTAKNDLVKHFLPEQGFELGADGRYRRDLHAQPASDAAAFPIEVNFATSLSIEPRLTGVPA